MNRSLGFTLIEVLIAAMILFMAVSAALMSYQTALKGSVTAARFLELAQVIELSRHHIKDELNTKLNDSLETDYQGNFSVAGVKVDWEARRVASAAPPERFDPEELAFTTYEKRFFMYRVEITMTYKQLSRSFSYEELAWLNRVEVAP